MEYKRHLIVGLIWQECAHVVQQTLHADAAQRRCAYPHERSGVRSMMMGPGRLGLMAQIPDKI